MPRSFLVKTMTGRNGAKLSDNRSSVVFKNARIFYAAQDRDDLFHDDDVTFETIDKGRRLTPTDNTCFHDDVSNDSVKDLLSHPIVDDSSVTFRNVAENVSPEVTLSIDTTSSSTTTNSTSTGSRTTGYTTTGYTTADSTTTGFTTTGSTQSPDLNFIYHFRQQSQMPQQDQCYNYSSDSITNYRPFLPAALPQLRGPPLPASSPRMPSPLTATSPYRSSTLTGSSMSPGSASSLSPSVTARLWKGNEIISERDSFSAPHDSSSEARDSSSSEARDLSTETRDSSFETNWSSETAKRFIQRRSNSFQDGITIGYTYDAFFVSDGRARRRNLPHSGMVVNITPDPLNILNANNYKERYKCGECGKHYATSSNLSRHKQTHRSLESQQAKQCPHCRKIYVSMPALSMHILTHDLKYPCSLCAKAFSRPWLLQGHLRSHSGEKPYGCTHCGRAFADRSNLRAHMQTHSMFKMHSCPHCAKSFALKAYLNKHVESACSKDDEDSCSSITSVWSV